MSTDSGATSRLAPTGFAGKLMVMRSGILAACARCAIASAAALGVHAQAPTITANGDPSIRDDTIYRLAVDRRAFADQPFVYLLDDGVERFEKDGTGWRTYRQVVQLLTPESVRRWGELRLPYTADREVFTLNWVRVLDSAGKPINVKPPYQTEERRGLGSSGRGSIVHRISVSGLEVGTILDYSYTLRITRPDFPGHYATVWRVAPGEQVQRSRFMVNLPVDADPRIVERHLTFSRVDDVSWPRQVHRWATRDVRKVDRELYAPDSSYWEGVVVSSPITWLDVAKGFARYFDRSDLLRFMLQREVAEALRGASTHEDSLKRLYAWSASAPYCVSVSDAARATAAGRPTCFDRGIVMVAAARWLGYHAFPVLVSAEGAVDPDLPGFSGFDRIIAMVQEGEDEDRYRFFDPDAANIPFGELPPYEDGAFALVIRDDGEYTKLQLPVPTPSANRVEFAISGTIDPRGAFYGEWSLSALGRRRDRLRALLQSGWARDSLRGTSCAAALSDSLMARTDSGAVTMGDAGPVRITATMPICGGGMIVDAGRVTLLDLPLIDLSGRRQLALLNGSGSRTMPIDAGLATGNFEFVERFEVTLPDRWQARLPASVKASSPFGSYEATYTQSGARLRVERRLTGSSGIHPASDMPLLLEWLRARARDDAKVIAIDRR